MNKPLSLIVILLSISVLSCVPASKYRELQNASRQNMMDRDDYKTENLTLSMQNRETATRIAALEAEMTRTKQDIALAEIERNKAREELNTISDRYYALQNAQEDLVRGNLTETKKLLAELQAAQDNLRQKEDIMRQLEHSMDLRKISLDELNLELEKKNARMAELEKVLDTQKKIVEDLKMKVSEALMGFETKALQLPTATGRYISRSTRSCFSNPQAGI